MPPERVVLDGFAFRELVAGRPIRLVTSAGTSVVIILADVGWSVMLDAVDDAITEAAQRAVERA